MNERRKASSSAQHLPALLRTAPALATAAGPSAPVDPGLSTADSKTPWAYRTPSAEFSPLATTAGLGGVPMLQLQLEGLEGKHAAHAVVDAVPLHFETGRDRASVSTSSPWHDPRYLSLGVLILQNTSLVLTMRYSRIASNPDMLYIPSTAVFWMEWIKLGTCLALLLHEKRTADKFWETIHQEVWRNRVETLRMAIPSLVYAFQNNLLYMAISNLDAVTFQVSYQLKILTTALLSTVMLQRKFTSSKWLSLVLLMIGVALVQLQSPAKSTTLSQHDRGALSTAQNPLLGLFAVLTACFSSGFAGCYFEKVLKNSSGSLWTRNIQMGLFGVLFSFLTMILSDGKMIIERGMFHGYGLLTWLVILNQAFGGLVVALVVKYADNILKGFATSASIVLSGFISFLVLDFRPTLPFLLGTGMVIAAVFLYSRPVYPKGKPQ